MDATNERDQSEVEQMDEMWRQMHCDLGNRGLMTRITKATGLNMARPPRYLICVCFTEVCKDQRLMDCKDLMKRVVVKSKLYVYTGFQERDTALP